MPRPACAAAARALAVLRIAPAPTSCSPVAQLLGTPRRSTLSAPTPPTSVARAHWLATIPHVDDVRWQKVRLGCGSLHRRPRPPLQRALTACSAAVAAGMRWRGRCCGSAMSRSAAAGSCRAAARRRGCWWSAVWNGSTVQRCRATDRRRLLAGSASCYGGWPTALGRIGPPLPPNRASFYMARAL